MANYLEQVKADIRQYLGDNEWRFNIHEMESEDPAEVREELYNILWSEDSVTGNASGSYTFNREESKQHVLDDMDTVAEALKEFCVEAQTIGDKFISEDWDYFDVTARCYILGQALDEVLKEELGADDEAGHEDEPWINAPFYGENPIYDEM